MNNELWIGLFVFFGWPALCALFEAPDWFRQIFQAFGFGVILYLLGMK